MTSEADRRAGDASLRVRALSRLTGSGTPPDGRLDPSAAFQALYELALSPTTAPRALALLHELQVQQVELELQDEELRRSRSELEATLSRQAQLYDFAPVAMFTVDHDSVVIELNATGARMLGVDRDMLPGRPLDAFLTADSVLRFRSALARLGDGAPVDCRALQLAMPDGALHSVRASASRDPAGLNFLVALIDVGADAG